jgi:ABC-type lipoprotein export system ATPase subunit
MDRAAAVNRLEARALSLSYEIRGDERIQVLDIDQIAAEAGAAVGFAGPSGAGKTTLLYTLTGIELPDGGRVAWGGTELTALAEGQRDRWRRRHVGFVFQDFHLFEGLSPLDNVLLPTSFDRIRPSLQQRERAEALLAEFGVPDARKEVAIMSRGERQRVAIARALLRAPEILVVDEPTASLDAAAGASVIDLILGSCRASGATLLAVSHDAALLNRLDTVHFLVNGRLAAPGDRAA